MKIVITSTGNSKESNFDLRFGRAGWFCLFDEATKAISFVKNEFADAQGGAGTKAAEKMIELGVQRVVSGDFGPKAKELLDRFKIQMVIIQDDNTTIADILEKLSK